jgi:hypothetical protein
LTLLPVLWCNFFNPFNDTVNYCFIAESLPQGGMSLFAAKQTSEPALLSDSVLCACRVESWRLGAMFFLALCQALFARASALEVFPVVMTWGVVLNGATVYSLSRWALRVPRWPALIAPLLLLSVFNPLRYSAYAGFLSQVYGTAVMACGLTMLTRLHASCHRVKAMAVILGLILAAMVSFYSELAPVLFFGVGIHGFWQAVQAWRGGRLRDWSTVCGVAGASFVILANIEIARACRAVLWQIGVVGAGMNIAWSPLNFWAFALGTHRFYGSSQGPWILLTILATACLATGLRILWRRRLIGLSASLILLAALLVYFHWFTVDPWTGELGHSWSQFKLCKWAFPLVLAVEVAGLAQILRHVRWPKGIVCAGLVMVLALSVQPYLKVAHEADRQRELLNCQRPFTELQELRRHPLATSGKCVRVVHDNDGPLWPHRLIAYFLLSEPCIIPEPGTSGAGVGYVSGLNYVMMGEPPFEKPAEKLPCGLSLISGDRPVVFRVVAEEQNSPGARLSVWSPRAGPALLVLTMDSSKADRGNCDLQLNTQGGPPQRLQAPWGAAQGVAVQLPAGVSRVLLHWSPPQAKIGFATVMLENEHAAVAAP